MNEYKGYRIRTWLIDGYGWAGEVVGLPPWATTERGYSTEEMAIRALQNKVDNYRRRVASLSHGLTPVSTDAASQRR